MKVKVKLLALVLVCALLLPATVLAGLGPPVLFSGSVTINGAPAAAGVTIEVFADDTKIGECTVDGSGDYSFPVDSDYVGATIKFKIDGTVAGQAVCPDGFSEPTVDLDLEISDEDPPTVESKSPTGRNVSIDTVVTATFSEDMDCGTINETTFTLVGSDVPGVVTCDGDTATFTPDCPLMYDHEYTATLTTEITDAGGNPLASEYSWTFTTESGPFVAVDKEVTPRTIGVRGSGLGVEESTITLTVTGEGSGLGYASEAVWIMDTLPDYIRLEDNFDNHPDSISYNGDGTTTLRWFLCGGIDIDEEWEASFDVSSSRCGRVLANVVDESGVTYRKVEPVCLGGFGQGSENETTLFPKTYLTVRCEEEEPPCEGVTGGPPEMNIQSIWTDPAEVVQNQWVDVWISVGNSGGSTGTKSVSLLINGQPEQSQTVGVGPGGGENVLFQVRRAIPGTYTVSVEGREAQFTVLGMGPPQAAPAPPMASAGIGGALGTGGIIAIIVVIIALAIGLVIILKKQ